jgi:N-acetylmuramoyl-L-alanine amidase
MAGAIEAFFAARLPPAVTARGAEAPRIGKAAQIGAAQIGPAAVSP